MTIDLLKHWPLIVAIVTAIAAGSVLQYQVGELRRDVQRAAQVIEAVDGKVTTLLVRLAEQDGEIALLRHMIDDGG